MYSIFVHGRSGMSIDPRIPTMPGRSASGVSPARQTLLAPSAKRRELCSASRMKGKLHPTKRGGGGVLSLCMAAVV